MMSNTNIVVPSELNQTVLALLHINAMLQSLLRKNSQRRCLR